MYQQHPTGFPYALFVSEHGEQVNYHLALNEYIVRESNKKGKVYPLSLSEMKIYCDHHEIRKFLLKFGKDWRCYNGKVYFKRNLPQNDNKQPVAAQV